MKNKIISLLLACTIVSAEESKTEPDSVCQHFGYVEFGVGPLPIPLPIFGGGHRSQWNHHGIDISGQIATIVKATAIQTNVMYNYYFKPNLTSEFFTGVGISPLIMFSSEGHVYGISPGFVFGKQYRNETNDLRFFQLQVNFPLIAKENNYPTRVYPFPIVTLSYGIGF